MNHLTIQETALLGLSVLTRGRVADHRGSFSRIFCAEELVHAGWQKPIAQINHSVTKRKGTVRGMHFQRAPHAEMKLVSCIRGAVLDVAVDLRASSSSLLQWHAEELTPDNGRSLLIPEGFAHGFQTLTDDCELLYLHSVAWEPGAEAGASPLDPCLGIQWPYPVTEMSSRDAHHPLLIAYRGELP